jgi:hypothetical protein
VPRQLSARRAELPRLNRNTEDDARDSWVWKWLKGEETDLAAFSDPTAEADYSICVYTGPTSSLVAEAAVPADATKWSPVGSTGYRYRDRGGSSAGITKILARAGADGRASLVVRGRGARLPHVDLDLVEPVTVQALNNATGICWGSSYSGPEVIRNTTTLFRAKSP